MRLYVSLDYKSKDEIGGSIFNLPRKKTDEAIYLRFDGERVYNNVFRLNIKRPAFDKVITYMLDEIFECKMTGKDILFHVEQRIEHILKVLRGK